MSFINENFGGGLVGEEEGDPFINQDHEADSVPVIVEAHDVKPDVTNLLTSTPRSKKRKRPTPKTQTKKTAKNYGNVIIKTENEDKTPATTSTSAPPTQTLSFKNAEEFHAEMDRVISDVIDESLYLFQKDPREYHPYYLRSFKYITIGQQLGYVSSIKEVNSIWEKYDTICEAYVSYGFNQTFTAKESPYATFIKTGKVIVNGKEINMQRNEMEVQERLNEVEEIARKIVNDRKLEGKIGEIRSDLGVRLEFFSHCKTITFPADCVAMNEIWSSFLNHFETVTGEEEQAEPPTQPPQPSTSSPRITIKRLSVKHKIHSKVKKSADSGQAKVKSKKVSSSSASTALKRLKGRCTNKSAENEQKNKLEMMICSSTSSVKKNTSKKAAIKRPPNLSSGLASSAAEPPTSNKSQINTSTQDPTVKSFSKSISTQKQRRTRTRTLSKLKKKSKTILGTGTKDKAKAKAKLEMIICSKKKLPHKLKANREAKPNSAVAAPPPPELPLASASSHSLKLENRAISEEDSSAKKQQQTEETESATSTTTHMCEDCGQILYTKASLKLHKRTHHNPNSSECPICHEELENGRNLLKHFEKEHANSSTTEMETVEIKPRLGGEISISDSSVCCEICGRLLSSRDSLKKHILNAHSSSTKDNQHVCPYCPKQFKSRDWMNAHVRQVHLGENYQCDLCGKNMQASGKLWRHKVDVHGLLDLEPPPGVNLQKCHICGEQMLRGMLKHISKLHPGQEANYQKMLNKKKKEKKTEKPSEEQRLRIQERSKLRKREARRKLREKGIGPAWLQKEFKCCRQTGLQSTLSLNLIPFLTKLAAIESLTNDNDEEELFPQWRCSICSSPEALLKGKEETTLHFLLKHQQTLEKLGLKDQLQSEPFSLPLDCPYCEEKLPSGSGSQQDNLRIHVERFHPEQCSKCPECLSNETAPVERIVISPEDLQEHFFLEHLTTPESFLKAAELIKTSKRVKKKFNPLPASTPGYPFSCPVSSCSEKFKYSEDMTPHMTQNHPENIFYCGFCPPTSENRPKFTRRAYLHHISERHGGMSKVLEVEPRVREGKILFTSWALFCELCGNGKEKEVMVTQYRKHLKERHELQEDGDLFRCPCPKQFVKREFWMLHCEEMHGGKAEELFEIAKKLNVSEDVDLEQFRREMPRKATKVKVSKPKKVQKPKPAPKKQRQPSKKRSKSGERKKRMTTPLVKKEEPETPSEDSNEAVIELDPAYQLRRSSRTRKR